MTYWDHNATAPLRPAAKAAVLKALELTGNPFSVHAAGRAARAMVETARDQVAAFAGADPREVIFTSGGTEANALALRGSIAAAMEAGERITRLLVAATAHDSVLSVAASLAETVPGLRLTIIPVNGNGRIEADEFRSLLMNGKGRALVSLILTNNETGVIEDVAALNAVLRTEGGADSLLHVDAVSNGYSEMRFSAWGADYLSLASHKIGGPQGAGALIVKERAPLSPLFNGAQEGGRRAGTHNVMGIAGFGAAAAADIGADSARIASIREEFEERLLRLNSAIRIFGSGELRQSNVSSFAIPDLKAETALIALDLDGIFISSGAACSSGKVTPSHVLAAMGVPECLSRCALRVSFGPETNQAELDEFFRSLTKLLERRLQLAGAA
jgi:cysteine desulfurase